MLTEHAALARVSWVFFNFCAFCVFCETKIKQISVCSAHLSPPGTQSILINKFNQKMMNKFILDASAAARELSMVTLAKADRAFYRQRRLMEKEFHLRNGIFSRV